MTRKRIRKFKQASHACHREVHWLCLDAVRCACDCHTEALNRVLDELLVECERRARDIGAASSSSNDSPSSSVSRSVQLEQRRAPHLRD